MSRLTLSNGIEILTEHKAWESLGYASFELMCMKHMEVDISVVEALSAYDDTLGNTGDMADREAVERLLSKFPIFGTVYTKPEIASLWARSRSDDKDMAGDTVDEETA